MTLDRHTMLIPATARQAIFTADFPDGTRLAANNKCLAESNKSEARGRATKRHDNDFAQIPFRCSMHPAGRNDRRHRDPLLLPPTLQR